MSSCEYPASLRYADITPAFKKDDKTDKTNYRPIGGHTGALLTDLSKGFDAAALKFIYSYLKGRTQRTKINFSYSSFAEILFDVPRINSWATFCDLFYDIDGLDFASSADDNTSYSCLSDMKVLRKYLIDLKKILKENADKCHLITSSKTPVGIEVSNIP